MEYSHPSAARKYLPQILISQKVIQGLPVESDSKLEGPVVTFNYFYPNEKRGRTRGNSFNLQSYVVGGVIPYLHAIEPRTEKPTPQRLD